MVGQHIAALDGIRGTAILLVVIHHLARSVEFEFNLIHPLLRGAAFGWIGVDLFFVLSGFLITGILYDSKASGGYFKNFHMRRVLRIFPLYYGALLLVLLLRAIWPEAGIYGSESQAWVWVYLTNVVIARKGLGVFGLVDHFWYLAVEQHFYLVWPLAVFLLNRRWLMQLAGGLFTLKVSGRTLELMLDLGTRFTPAGRSAQPGQTGVAGGGSVDDGHLGDRRRSPHGVLCRSRDADAGLFAASRVLWRVAYPEPDIIPAVRVRLAYPALAGQVQLWDLHLASHRFHPRPPYGTGARASRRQRDGRDDRLGRACSGGDACCRAPELASLGESVPKAQSALQVSKFI